MPKDYTFHPRPEAHPMRWSELMSPLRRAIRDLLLLLDGAVNQVDRSIKEHGRKQGEQITANCFLVYGERGTGKTTVLLSAKNAVYSESEDENHFFSLESEADLVERGKEKQFRAEAKRSANNLRDRGIVWLDVLDLESLPPHANMLTTMLTRVLHALDARGKKKPETSPRFDMSSIMEEDADNARHQLTRLINDATVMWEDIREVNTRDRANRQIYAADIFSRFRDRFEKAIESLSKELGPARGQKGERTYPIILPIDNIDRSTDHLHNIIKLAQMVASPYLWLVLSGDREDVETFLERAYWKELISIGEGAGGTGKMGLGKEDEALVMARRQAAAASHKLLPPSHRIEVELVRPGETLAFRRSAKAKTIEYLLSQIPIPKNDLRYDAPSQQDKAEKSLLDVLIAGKRCRKEGPTGPQDEEPATPAAPPAPGQSEVPKTLEEQNKALTHAANLALQLPARTVLDLWQQADRMSKDRDRFTGEKKEGHFEEDFRAEKIARSMLQNTIAESKVPSEMGLYLQDKMIHREPDGTTTLKFCKPNPTLKVTRWRVAEFQRRLHPALEPRSSNPSESQCSNESGPHPPTESEAQLQGASKPHPLGKPRYAIRSGIAAVGSQEVLVCSLSRDETGQDELELPPVVAGWLLVLHDVVVQAGRSWVIKKNLESTEIQFVCAKHNFVCTEGRRLIQDNLVMWWPAPKWETYRAHDAFWVTWENFLGCYRKGGGLRIRADYLAWVLAVGWMACVVETFWALDGSEMQREAQSPVAGQTHYRHEKQLSSALTRILRIPEDGREASISAQEYVIPIQEAEAQVVTAAAMLYSEMMRVREGATDEQVFFERKGLNLMRDWLEEKMPLLLSHLYVPLYDEAAKPRQQNLERLFGVQQKNGAEREAQGPHCAEEGKKPEEPEQQALRQLGQMWFDNFPFIYAEYDAQLAKMFAGWDKSEADKRQMDYPGAFGTFYGFINSLNFKPAEH